MKDISPSKPCKHYRLVLKTEEPASDADTEELCLLGLDLTECNCRCHKYEPEQVEAHAQ